MPQIYHSNATTNQSMRTQIQYSTTTNINLVKRVL